MRSSSGAAVAVTAPIGWVLTAKSSNQRDSRFAAPVFLVSLVGALISFAYQFTADAPASMHGGMENVIPVVILIAIVAQWYYARRMAAAGVLR